MVKVRFVILFSFFALNTVISAQAPPDVANDPTWALWLEDNFDGAALDISKWYVYNNFDHFGGDDVVFIDDNVTQSGGNLILTFKKENYTCPAPYGQPGDNYNCVRQATTGLSYTRTSGYVATKPNYDFQYGYIEARIKMPYAYGMFPALWTFYGWTVVDQQNAAEIDIFEMKLGSQLNQDIMTTNLHYNYDSNNPLPPNSYLEDVVPGGYNNIWVTYGLEWNPNEIIWYVNGSVFRVYPTSLDQPHEIHDMVKLIIDLGIELNFEPNTSTPSTVEMLIDYVKIYQRDGNCNLAYNACNFPFGTYQNTIKKGIVVGGFGCANIQPVGTTLYLVAKEIVVINAEFTVPLGATLIIETDPNCYVISN